LKKIFLVIFLFIICASVSFGDVWVNSLKPKGVESIFVASKDGVANCVIVIPDAPLPTEVKASEELKNNFKEICNTDFSVIKESELKKGLPYISVGNTNLAKNAKLGMFSVGIKEEGFAIIAKDGNLFLLGGSRRGPLYAAYGLLEEDMGVRWYDKNGVKRIQKSKNLIIKYVPRQFNPKFETRFPGLVESFDSDFCLRNRINPFFFSTLPNELGGSTYPWGLCHTLLRIITPEEYFATHPEYFSEHNGKREPGQLCLSNPDVIKLLTEKTKKILKENSSKYISLSPMDGVPLCDCEKCNELDKKEGSKAATLINALNQIGNNIKEEFPDRKILTLAYLDYYVPPKTIKPVDNVVVQICSDSHDWSYPFCTIPETDKFSQGLKQWVKNGAETMIWMYTDNYDHALIPNPNMELVGENLKYLAKSGAGGVFMQDNCWGIGNNSGYMRSWVWGKQLWNPNLDTKSLMKDFIYGYYGESAEPIWKYQELLLSLWEDNHKKPHNIRTKPYTTNSENPLMVWDNGGIRFGCDISLYTDDFVKKSLTLLNEAQKLVKTPELLDRVNLMRAQIIYLAIGKGLGYYTVSNSYVSSKDVKAGNVSNFPYYEKLWNDLDEVIKKENIKKFSEVYSYDDAPMKMAQWKAILDKKLVFPIKYSNCPIAGEENSSWVDLEEDYFKYAVGENEICKRVDDLSANNKRAAYMSSKESNWYIQYELKQLLDCGVDFNTVDLYVVYKVIYNGSSELAFNFGVYDAKNPTYYIMSGFNGNDTVDGNYTTKKMGSLTTEQCKNSYIYFSQQKDGIKFSDSMYIDRIIAVLKK